MNDSNGQLLTETCIRFERLLPGPIERVWEFLTSSEFLPAWFGDAEHSYTIEPRVGGAVNMADGHIRGTVTQWKPPRLLIYTWNVFSPEDIESRFPESYVQWELQTQGDQVLLTLIHRPMLAGFENQSMMGWHTFLEMLESLLKGQTPEPRKDIMQRNMTRYGITEIRRS